MRQQEMVQEHIIPLKTVLVDEIHDSALIGKVFTFSLFLVLFGRIANEQVYSFNTVPSQLFLQAFYTHIAIDNWSDGQGKGEHFVGSLLCRVELEVSIHNFYESDGLVAEGDHKRLDVFDLRFLFQVVRVGIDEEITHLRRELSHVERVVLFGHG